MWEGTGVTVTVAAFLLNLVVVVIGGFWKLTRVEKALRDDIDSARSEIDERVERRVREFGETSAAIRQKVNDVELWVRDHCVQVPAFDRVVIQLERSIQELGAALKDDFRRLEDKIDGKA